MTSLSIWKRQPRSRRERRRRRSRQESTPRHHNVSASTQDLVTRSQRIHWENLRSRRHVKHLWSRGRTHKMGAVLCCCCPSSSAEAGTRGNAASWQRASEGDSSGGSIRSFGSFVNAAHQSQSNRGGGGGETKNNLFLKAPIPSVEMSRSHAPVCM